MKWDSSVVIDSNVVVWATLPGSSTTNAAEKMAWWSQIGTQLWAPDFWLLEAASAVRRGVYSGQMLGTEGTDALQRMLELGIHSAPISDQAYLSAYHWATRLNQIRVYDGAYLALAEMLGTELWTADRRLANQAQQVGAPWVRWIGET